MIEVDGIELRTAAQWEKKHRHVKKGQLGKGVERAWRSPNGNTTAMFYREDQTRPWAKRDVDAVNRKRRAEAKAKRDAAERERIERAAREEQSRADLLDCWGGSHSRRGNLAGGPPRPHGLPVVRAGVRTHRRGAVAAHPVWRQFRMVLLPCLGCALRPRPRPRAA